MKNFKTFDVAVDFYKQTLTLPLKGDAKSQLNRAARSIALNLAEARGKNTRKEQLRFFHIALGSLRECQGLLILEELQNHSQWNTLDKLAAHLYKLIKNAK